MPVNDKGFNPRSTKDVIVLGRRLYNGRRHGRCSRANRASWHRCVILRNYCWNKLRIQVKTFGELTCSNFDPPFHIGKMLPLIFVLVYIRITFSWKFGFILIKHLIYSRNNLLSSFLQKFPLLRTYCVLNFRPFNIFITKFNKLMFFR